VFQTYVSSVLFIFRHILQVLRLDISKGDRVLHMLQCDPPTVAAGGGTRVGRGCIAGSGGRADAAWGRVGHRRRVGSSSRVVHAREQGVGGRPNIVRALPTNNK
jgi:hypothetical protein